MDVTCNSCTLRSSSSSSPSVAAAAALAEPGPGPGAIDEDEEEEQLDSNSCNCICSKKKVTSKVQVENELEKYRNPNDLYLDLTSNVTEFKSHLMKYFSLEDDNEIENLLTSLDLFVKQIEPIVLNVNKFDFANIPVNGYRSLIRHWIKFFQSACEINSHSKLKKFSTSIIIHLSSWPVLLEETMTTSMANKHDPIIGRSQAIYFYSTYNYLIHKELMNKKMLRKMFNPTLNPFLNLFLRIAVWASEPSMKKRIINQHYLFYNDSLNSLLKQISTIKPEIAAQWVRSADWFITQTYIKTINHICRPLGYNGIHFDRKCITINCPRKYTIKLTDTNITLETNCKESQLNGKSNSNNEKVNSNEKQCTSTRIKVYVLHSSTSKDNESKINTFKSRHEMSLETELKKYSSKSNKLNENENENEKSFYCVDETNSCSNNSGNKNNNENGINRNNNNLTDKIVTSKLVKSKTRFCSFYSKLNANGNSNELNNEGESVGNIDLENLNSINENVKSDDDVRRTKTNIGKTIVYIHGGAFLGPNCSSLINIFLKDWSCRIPGVTFIIPEYSYSPESTFPTAWQEMLDFYIWLITTSKSELKRKLGVNIDKNKLILSGDSSGGLLSSSLLVMLNEINIKYNTNLTLPPEVILLFPKSSLRVEMFPSTIMSNYDLLINGFMLLRVAQAVLPITYKNDITGEVKLITQEERKNLPTNWFNDLHYQVLDSPILSPVSYDKMNSFKDINLHLLVVTFDPLLDDGILFARKWKGKINFHVADDVCHGAYYYRQFAPCAYKLCDEVLQMFKRAVDSL